MKREKKRKEEEANGCDQEPAKRPIIVHPNHIPPIKSEQRSNGKQRKYGLDQPGFGLGQIRQSDHGWTSETVDSWVHGIFV